MNIYSFRAEATYDVREFELRCMLAGIAATITYMPHEELPDVKGEVRTEASLETLLSLLSMIDDTHVMSETLRPGPLSTNDLIRR